MSLEFPYEIKDVEKEVVEKIKSDFRGYKDDTAFVKVLPKNYLFPEAYRKYAFEFYNFEVRPDDIWVVTFPRSGTTLTQELVWLIANDLDFDTASKCSLPYRFPFIDATFLASDKTRECLEEQKPDQTFGLKNSMIENTKNLKSPRFIKTHLPFSLLPPSLPDTAKCITVIRNPRDVAASNYYHHRSPKFISFSNTFDVFWDYFENGLIYPCPYWEHIKESWELRHHPNILVLYYEDIISDWKKTIDKVSRFLNKKLTDEENNKLLNHMQIDNFRNNPAVNFTMDEPSGSRHENEQPFIRKGKTEYGSKEEYNSEELNTRVYEWIDCNLENFSFDFKYQSVFSYDTKY